jgi:hypothetical protein
VRISPLFKGTPRAVPDTATISPILPTRAPSIAHTRSAHLAHSSSAAPSPTRHVVSLISPLSPLVDHSMRCYRSADSLLEYSSRDGNGSGLERISVDFGYRFSPTGPRIWISAILWVWSGFYISPADAHWSSAKLSLISPHRES